MAICGVERGRLTGAVLVSYSEVPVSSHEDSIPRNDRVSMVYEVQACRSGI